MSQPSPKSALSLTLMRPVSAMLRYLSRTSIFHRLDRLPTKRK